jgi:hypothetical protein
VLSTVAVTNVEDCIQMVRWVVAAVGRASWQSVLPEAAHASANATDTTDTWEVGMAMSRKNGYTNARLTLPTDTSTISPVLGPRSSKYWVMPSQKLLTDGCPAPKVDKAPKRRVVESRHDTTTVSEDEYILTLWNGIFETFYKNDGGLGL